MRGPVAPRDPEKKRQFYYLMKDKSVFAAPLPDGKGLTPIYLDGGRLVEASKFVGNLSDEKLIDMLKTAEGFKKLVHSIGVVVDGCGREKSCRFVFQFYGKNDLLGGGTLLEMPVSCNGSEHLLDLSSIDLTDEDKEVGQCRFEFDENGFTANVTVKLYLNDGFDAPIQEEDAPCDLTSKEFAEHVKNSVIQTGNTYRFNKAVEKAKRGEDTTIAFIGGSITQGAGAVPINTQCYAYKTYEAFKKLTGMDENIHYVKAGVGGTPSELGMIRYDRDVRKDGAIEPDVVIVEFAVNDDGDVLCQRTFEAIIRKAMLANPDCAVIAMYAVASYGNTAGQKKPVADHYLLPQINMMPVVNGAIANKTFTKEQYFTDYAHPTFEGHQFMSDCLMALVDKLDKAAKESEVHVPASCFKEPSLYGLKRILPGVADANVKIECGDFKETDRKTQTLKKTNAPDFPENWKKKLDAKAENLPFKMELTCKSLIFIYKVQASGDAEKFGKAEVYVDGRKVATYDGGKEGGWNNCEPNIIIDERTAAKHTVLVKMAPGSEKLGFTIVAMGYSL